MKRNKPPSLSWQAPLNQTGQAAPFKAISPITGFSWYPCPLPLKVGSFSEPSKYWSFSSLITSYLLKVTKFLGRISQFEFLVMAEKNIFPYTLIWSLNISDFNLFLCENCKIVWIFLKKYMNTASWLPNKFW